MKKNFNKIISLVLCLCMTFTLGAGMITTVYAGTITTPLETVPALHSVAFETSEDTVTVDGTTPATVELRMKYIGEAEVFQVASVEGIFSTDIPNVTNANYSGPVNDPTLLGDLSVLGLKNKFVYFSAATEGAGMGETLTPGLVFVRNTLTIPANTPTGDYNLTLDWIGMCELDYVYGDPRYTGDDPDYYLPGEMYTDLETVTIPIHVENTMCTHDNAALEAAADPTCTEAGNTAYWFCDDCDKYFADNAGAIGDEIAQANTVVAATGHDWGAWEVTTDPTCTVDGEETRECANDPADVETRAVDALGHNFENGVCTRCGELAPSNTLELVFDGIVPDLKDDAEINDDDQYLVESGDVIKAKAVITTQLNDIDDDEVYIRLESLESTINAAGLEIVSFTVNDELRFKDGKLEKPYGAAVNLIRDTATVLGEFELKVPETAADATVYAPTFEDGAYYMYNNNSQEVDLLVSGFEVIVSNIYSITFDDTAVTGEYQTGEYRFGTTVTAPAIDWPDAKRFLGWVDSAIPETVLDDAATTANAAKTFIGQWEDIPQPYNFYDADYVTVLTSGTAIVGEGINNVEYTGTIPPGQSFVGWATTTGAAVEDIVEFPYEMIVDGVDFYPVFEYIEYTFYFEENEGSEVADITVTYESVVTPADYTTTRNGYDFGGWFEDIGLTIAAAAEYKEFTADMTLYAKWTEEEYNISFYSDTTTESDIYATETAIYNTPLGDDFPDGEPTKDGFEFQNWIDEDGNVVDNTTIFTGDTNVFPVWDTPYGGFKCEEYWYAPTGYVMLRIQGTEGTGYSYDGHAMYKSTKSDYFDAEGADCAYIWLIKRADVKDALSKITYGATGNVEVQYDGEVNGNDTWNYADANAVYQMLNHTGDYYGVELNADGTKLANDDLGMLDRFEADVYTGTRNATFRSSIQDVEKAYTLYKTH